MSKQVADSYDIRPSSKDLLKYVLLDGGAAFFVENSYQKRANNKVTIEYTFISVYYTMKRAKRQQIIYGW